MRRPRRSRLIHQLVAPIATRIRRRIPRARRAFARAPLRWSLARRSPGGAGRRLMPRRP